MGYKLAIDFGTTNSVVACWDGSTGRPETVIIPNYSTCLDDQRKPLVPSLVYVHDGRDGQAALGQEVLSLGLDRQRDNRLFRSFKRMITAGTTLEPRLIDGVPWTDSDAGRFFLRRLLGALPIPQGEIEQLVMTVPVGAYEGYTAWLSKSVPDALADKIRIVDESTAAALGYAVTEPGSTVLVVDFGGGSLDLSLAQLPEGDGKGSLMGRLRGKEERRNAAHVIAKAGATLGGSDVDQWMLAEVLERSGVSVSELGQGYAGLMSACEQAKILLSTVEETRIDFQSDAGHVITLPFKRADLESLLEGNGFFSALTQALDKVMRVAHRRGVFKEDVDQVLLVGGTSLMPSVQRSIHDYFSDQSGQEHKDMRQLPPWPAVTWTIREMTVRVDKPFTAVVEGALQVAAGFGLEDYLAHSYGLRYLDPVSGKHRYDEVIPMGTRYPMDKPVEVRLGAAHKGQKSVEFVLGQIDTDAVSTVEVKYEGGQAVFVARADHEAKRTVTLNAPGSTTVTLSPPGVPGPDRLRAAFWVDSMRRLRLSVTDLDIKVDLLQDAVLVTLGEGQSKASDKGKLTGNEPRLSSSAPAGGYRLSLRGLATTLNLLPPEKISLEALAEALRSPDYSVRYNAAELLSRRGDRDARRIFEDVLTKGAPPLRASVAQHLHMFSWFVAEALYRQALDDADTRVRESAVLSLCKLRTRDGFQLLVEKLPGEDDAVLLAAAWGLSTTPDYTAVPVLAITLQAHDPEIRDVALEGLGQTRSADAIAVVRRAIDDPELDVKYSATLSMIELAEAGCLEELAGIIRQHRGWERQRIIRGLFHATNYLQIKIGSTPSAEVVIQALEDALQDDLPETRLAAAMPLAWMRHPHATEALKAGYRHETDGETKANILFAAVSLMSPAAEELSAEALESPIVQVRQTAEYLREHRRG